MNTYKLVAAALALSATPAVAAAADCCADMACCKEGADCCEDGKDKEGAHAAHVRDHTGRL